MSRMFARIRLCSSKGESKRLISAGLVVRIHPQPPHCGVAKLVRHRIVNPAIEGSNPSATAISYRTR